MARRLNTAGDQRLGGLVLSRSRREVAGASRMHTRGLTWPAGQEDSGEGTSTVPGPGWGLPWRRTGQDGRRVPGGESTRRA